MIAVSLPDFGAILNLIGATTITLLNFVFPPLFYLRLCGQEGVEVSRLVRLYCWHLVLVTSAAGTLSLITSFGSVRSALAAGASCWLTL